MVTALTLRSLTRSPAKPALRVLRRALGGGALLAALALGATPAAAWVTTTGSIVTGGADDITVRIPARAGKQEYFCAAAQYARFRLGARGTDRVVVKRPLGIDAAGQMSVGFTLSATAPSSPGVFLTPTVEGTARSVAHGQSLCREGHSSAPLN
ncbi:hypothetical protein ATO2_01255 [Roseovarius sp. 22II1-1F6A]|nr:hypothetical protein ATO2_01255 [Roseovarius sp. 22II1-1F6A]